MLDDATAKQFEAVLVYRIDRLSRNLKDLIDIVEELAKNNIGFKSITELIDTTTPEGRLMFHQFRMWDKLGSLALADALFANLADVVRELH